MRRTPPNKPLVLVALLLAAFMINLDTTIVNVALPDLGKEFRASTTSIEWIVLGYLLSLAVWIPASGWIGDRFGTRRVFLFAIGMIARCALKSGGEKKTDNPPAIAVRLLERRGALNHSPRGYSLEL